MTRYPLERAGKLLLTKAAISGPAGVRVVRLLVDTGSTYTILPVEVLESVGCSPAASTDHVRLITGSGYLIAPKV
jgi:predicted aspartyl protease